LTLLGRDRQFELHREAAWRWRPLEIGKINTDSVGAIALFSQVSDT
jgi:hypothetical protein